MRCPRLDELPPPPPGRTGWPWTEETPAAEPATNGNRPWPRISMVTPSYNQGQFLEETIRSVLLQGYPDLEYFIIDGGSSDDSIAIIRKYERFLTGWVSEPDRGQYDAINKGIARCQGDLFNWINSDDLLLPGALISVGRAGSVKPTTAIAGPIVMVQPDGSRQIMTPRHLSRRNLLRLHEHRALDMVFMQQGLFLPLAAVRQVGGLRAELDLVSDLILAADVLQHCGIEYLDAPLALFRIHETCKTHRAGHLSFKVELLETLQSMPDVWEFFTPRELHHARARHLARLAGRQIAERQILAGTRTLIRAFWASPGQAWREVRGR